MNNMVTTNGSIVLSGDNLNAVKKAMKIGFYKSFYNKGIINATQFERLMQMQNEKAV